MGKHSQVTGGTSTDNAIARFDGTGGAIQNSGVTVSDAGSIESSGTGSRFLAIQSSDSTGLLYLSSASAQVAQIELRTSGAARWAIRKDSTAESGGTNDGSNLVIQSRGDAGTSDRLTINRASGLVTVGTDLTVNGVLRDTVTVTSTAGTGSPLGYTLVLADRGKMIETTASAAINVNIPTNNSVAFPIGTRIDVLQVGTGQVTIAGAGVTINGTPGLKLRTQWSSCTMIKRATDTWVVIGDLVA